VSSGTGCLTAVLMQLKSETRFGRCELGESPREVSVERRMLTPDDAKRLLSVVESNRLVAPFCLDPIESRLLQGEDC
jgi:hypothetical protein